MLNFFSLQPYLLPVNQPPELPAIVEEVRPVEPEVKLVFNSPPKWTLCSCVETAKYILGRQASGSWGNAWNIVPDDGLGPTVGAVVITNERWGHIGVVVSKSEDKILIREGNFKKCKLTERELDIKDKRIRGFKLY